MKLTKDDLFVGLQVGTGLKNIKPLHITFIDNLDNDYVYTTTIREDVFTVHDTLRKIPIDYFIEHYQAIF